MTTKEYLKAIETRYPNTFIGINAYYKRLNPNMINFVSTYANVPLDHLLTKLITYLEYRGVNFLDAMCNTQIENVGASHEMLRFKTVTVVISRLENFISPVEGLPF
jgi:hypothetical protein